MIDGIRKVPNVRMTTFIKNILNSFIQGDSFSLLLFKLSNNLYIITDNFETQKVKPVMRRYRLSQFTFAVLVVAVLDVSPLLPVPESFTTFHYDNKKGACIIS